MDAEERRALEAELAAELAGLADGDDDYNDELIAVHHDDNAQETTSSPGRSGDESEYVRLDLNQLLRQFAASDQETRKQRTQQSSTGREGDGETPAMSCSWGLLLASVQTSDADFFQFIRQDLHDIQTTFLIPPVDASAASSPASNADPASIDVNTSRKSGDDLPASSIPATLTTISENASLPVEKNGTKNDKNEHIQPSQSDLEPQAHEQIVSSDDPVVAVALPWNPAPYYDRAATEDQVSKRREASNSTQDDRLFGCALPAEPPEPAVPDQESQLLDQVSQNQLKLIQEHHLTRQRQLQRVQEARQLEHELIARQIQEMETRFAEEDEKRKRREVEQQQARERLAMQEEEVLIRKCIAETQRLRETELMVLEERISRVYHGSLREEQRNRERERLMMASEEAFEWRRARFEAEKQRRERLMEEKCVLRRRLNTVMFQLVANHEAKVANQKKQEDAAKRREAHELALMRTEELAQRRVFAQKRANEEERNRNREHEVMASEDAFARDWAVDLCQRVNRERSEMESEDRLAMEIRIAAERRQQDVNRLLMAREEERSRMMQVLEIQRQHVQVRRQEACRRILVHRKRVAYLGLAWSRWVCVVAGEMEAVQRIQRCYRMYKRRRLHECEDEAEATADYASEEASAAAMVVQSMFRGFSIRRKFANALEMAQLVGEVDEIEFGEVNLDDLIQMPPELADGWENPVLPVPRPSHQRYYHQHQIATSVVSHFDEEEGPESGDYEDPEQPAYGNYAAVIGSVLNRVGTGSGGGGGSPYSNNIVVPQSPRLSKQVPIENATPPVPAPPASLASNLWDKMRKMKQKQRHAAEERSREQDPTYRLQKFMSKGNKRPQQQISSKILNDNGNQGHTVNTTASSAPTISWGSSNSSGEKKKPKVKLPSLVERLRKKTEAAR